MPLLSIILLVVAFLSFLVAGLFWFQSSREKAVIFYGFLIFFAAVWTLSYLAMNLPASSFSTFKMGIILHYPLGAVAYLSWFWFAVYFPRRTIRSLIFPVTITVLYLLMLGFVVLKPAFLFNSIQPALNLADRIKFNPFGYWTYTLSTLVLLISGMSMVVSKFSLFKDADKKQFKYFVYWNFFTGAFAIILVLVLPWFGIFTLFLANPIFITVSLIIIGFYTVLTYNIFNVKTITAELFVFFIWSLLFVRALTTAKTIEDRLIDGIIILAVVILGVLIIRSVLNENKQKEQLKNFSEKLQEMVKERTKELNEKVAELDKWYHLTVGRELRMAELKKEISELKEKLKSTKK